MTTEQFKVMLQIMQSFNRGIIPTPGDYGITSTELWDIIDECQREGFIHGATHAGSVLFLDNARLTIQGLNFLRANTSE